MNVAFSALLNHERHLADRPSPLLADGTRLGDLIDFDKREVKMRVLSDPQVHRMELERIFARSWLIVGHVSEIPKSGDYVKRWIGEDQVLVTRGRNGAVNVLLNACAHRGMELCRTDQGNQPNFKCPYHGWVFDHAGNLLGAPFEKEMYGGWDKSQYKLTKAQVAIRHGVIFGAFRPICDLDEWLGEFAWYFDAMYGSVEMEVDGVFIGDFRLPANWKAVAEQNVGDNYHGVTLHNGLIEMGFPDWDLQTYGASSYDGHGLRFSKLDDGHFLPVEGNMAKTSNEEDSFPVSCGIAGSLFPHGAIGGQVVRTPDGPDSVGEKNGIWKMMLGGVAPDGPGAVRNWGLNLVQKSLPTELKGEMVGAGAMGVVVGADDLEAWPSITRAAQGVLGGEQPLRYNTLLGPNNPDNFPGPLMYHGVSKDDIQWNFWLRWYDMMTIEL